MFHRPVDVYPLLILDAFVALDFTVNSHYNKYFASLSTFWQQRTHLDVLNPTAAGLRLQSNRQQSRSYERLGVVDSERRRHVADHLRRHLVRHHRLKYIIAKSFIIHDSRVINVVTFWGLTLAHRTYGVIWFKNARRLCTYVRRCAWGERWVFKYAAIKALREVNKCDEF